MKKVGSLLEFGPGTPAWVVNNLVESSRLQSGRIAAARELIRDGNVDERRRPAMGSSATALSKAEELWLVDWVVQACTEIIDRAEISPAEPAKKLKRLEDRLHDLFAFVLSGVSYRRAEKSVLTAREKFTKIIANRKKAAAVIVPDKAPESPEPSAETSEAPKKKKRRGRKPKYDHVADARLLKQFRSLTPPLTEKEFADVLGKGNSFRLVRRALQRARTRERLKADYKKPVKTL